jgi:hypothetical protein
MAIINSNYEGFKILSIYNFIIKLHNATQDPTYHILRKPLVDYLLSVALYL